MRDACADFWCELAEFNGWPQHVHLLGNFPYHSPIPPGE